jgi:hypothetical protein
MILLRNKITGHIYSYHSEDNGMHKLTNLTTGVSGEISTAQLQDVMGVNLPLNWMEEKNGLLSKLISKLNLSIEQ